MPPDGPLWRGDGIRAFWQRISEGLTLQQLWGQFSREARESYRFYSKEFDSHVTDDTSWKGGFRLAGALFWAMIAKLSPARRVFLLIALLLLVTGGPFERPAALTLGALGLLALLALELADRVAMKRDLEIARDIQRWLVPQSPPSEPGVDIAFTTLPANTVAGDYYDAFRCPAAGPGPAHRLVLVVADVAGKSMPAALLMATFQSSLRTLVQEALPLDALVSRLNRYCCQHSLEGRRFTTAVIAELDPDSGTLVYVNAGHNPPALRRSSGEIEWLRAGGLPLGVQAEAAYETGALALAGGDRLVIFTDGVVEARNDRGEDYGDTRLAEWLRASRAATAAVAVSELVASVEAFAAGHRREDDVTVMVVHYRPA